MSPDRNDGPAGYVRLWRRITESPVWTTLEPTVLKVLLPFLLKANWKTKTWYDGHSQVEIPRGSFVTSYGKMAEFCQLSPKQARSAFAHLQRLEFAAYTRAGRWTMVTILNYETYQGSLEEEGTVEGRVRAGLGQDEGRQRATTKEVKKGRREEVTPEGGTASTSTALLDLSCPVLLAQPVTEEDVIRQTAERLRQRHPEVHRCGLTEVRRLLRAIVSKVPQGERAAKLAAVEANHAAWCQSEQWTKDGGQFAKGLNNWLAPTIGRFDDEPPAPAPRGCTTLPKATQQIAENLRRIHGTA